MRIKSRLIICMLFLCITGKCIASSLAIQVIQHSGKQAVLQEATDIIENTLMDYFFDKGYIVTNSRAAVAVSKDEDDKCIKKALNENLYGSQQYLATIIVEYQNTKESDNPEAALLSSISSAKWTIWNVINGHELMQGEYRPKITEDNNDADGVSAFAVQVASVIAQKMAEVR